MAEALVSIKETSKRLGISIRSFHRHRKKLIAVGLQIVRLGQRVTVRERSIDSIFYGTWDLTLNRQVRNYG